MHSTYSINILMIEDNPGDQFLLAELLISAGFEKDKIIIAGKLAEAGELLQHNKFDIVLLDLSLPDSNGIDSFHYIIKDHPDLPVIILSGITDMKLALDAINLGAQDYLIKGDFGEKLLAKTLLYSIERSHSLQALKESNERNDLLNKLTNDMVWDWDLQTGQVSRNKEGWKKIVNAEDGELSTTVDDWNNRIHPDDLNSTKEILDSLFQSNDKDFFEIELRIQRNNGTYANVVDKGFLIRDKSGKPIRLIGASKDITGSKEAEFKLLQSEKRYRTLIENSSDGIIIFNPNGQPQDMSPSAQRILGYTQEAYLKKDPFKLIHPEFRDSVAETLIELVRNKDASIITELLYKKADGNYTWIETTIHNQLHEAAVNAIVITFRDISDRKKNEGELKKLSHIARETNNSVVITNAKAEILWVNEAFTRLTGYTLKEVAGKRQRDFLNGPETDPVAQRYMKIQTTNGRGFKCDVLNYTKNKEKYWSRILCQPQLDANGKLKGFFSLQTDITTEKEAESLVKASEEKYRHLFDFNPNSIIIWDPYSFKILEVNKKAVEEYGYEKDEFLSKTILDFRSASETNILKNVLEKIIKENCIKHQAVWEHYDKEGNLMLMNYVSHLVKYNHNPAVLALGENITAKVKLEKALDEERTKKQFEITEAVLVAQEDERRKIGGDLHDNINQILASSLLYLGLSKKEIEKDVPYLNEAEKLINAVIHEVRSLSHSLVFPHLAESGLADALDNVIKITTLGGVNIHKDFSKINEDDISEELKLNIYRIVQEQLNNILKHAKADNVFISVENKGNVTRLIIKDDGVGFDKNDKNIGVGLMNIKTRASLFNSDVNINSSAGKGCEINIVFNPAPVLEKEKN